MRSRHPAAFNNDRDIASKCDRSVNCRFGKKMVARILKTKVNQYGRTFSQDGLVWQDQSWHLCKRVYLSQIGTR